MPQKRLSVRKIKEVLRLHYDHGLSQSAISRACGVVRSTVQRYIVRFEAAGLAWPVSDDLDDPKLNALLFGKDRFSQEKRPKPDWAAIHREMSRKGVTLRLLWLEYRDKHPDGYRYSRFCELYRIWTGQLSVTMRQRHKAGEKIFVDYTGLTMEVIDPATGEINKAEIFVAVMGFSNYTFAYAVPSQSLGDWIHAHTKALKFFGGCPEIIVPDNLKSGVNSPCRYDPELNPTYHEWAEHYDVAVIPARVRKPRDKAKAENGVLNVERWLMAPLRNRRFFSLEDLNKALAERLKQHNDRPMQKIGVSRRQLFLEAEKPVLRALPCTDYEPSTWKQAKVHLDYHVEVDRHYYSVPYTYVHKRVEIRTTKSIVEIFHEGKRIASHQRNARRFQHTTCSEHMPRKHQEVSSWTPGYFERRGKQLGPSVAKMISVIINSRKHPEQGYRSALGLLQLEKHYGSHRLEKACERALYFDLNGRKPVLEILKKKQDMLELPVEEDLPLFTHPNIRGPEFYQ